MNTGDQITPQSAGALTFSPDGVLFLGDNKLGAVFAFETERGQAPASLDPFIFESIDEKIAEALGVSYKTVANTCSQIKAKLGVVRTADLVRLSIEMGVT